MVSKCGWVCDSLNCVVKSFYLDETVKAKSMSLQLPYHHMIEMHILCKKLECTLPFSQFEVTVQVTIFA